MALVALAALFGGGCGGGTSPSEDRSAVRELVTEAQADLRAKRLDEFCDALTDQAHVQIGRSGHGDLSTCPRDVREMLELVETTLSRRAPDVKAIRLDGDRASVRLVTPIGSTVDVPVLREDGAWRISNFYGADTMPEKIVTALADSPSVLPQAASHTPPAGRAVRVANGRRACRPLMRSAPNDVTGGCTGRIVGGATEFDVQTAIGSFPLAAVGCAPFGSIRLDGDGRIALDDSSLQTPDKHLCADTKPCTDDQGDMRPWEGRLTKAAGSRLKGSLNICVATCVGRFRGKVPLAAIPGRRAWRLRFAASPVAAGGLTLNGSWEARGLDGLRVHARWRPGYRP